MKMGMNDFSDKDVINKLKDKELEKIFKYFGEEKEAKQIVKSIVKHRQSEQIDTDVILQSGIFEGKWRAGGVMLQKMPDLKVDNNIKSNSNNKKNSELKLQNLVSLDEEWSSAQILMSSVKTSELLDSSITPETLT